MHTAIRSAAKRLLWLCNALARQKNPVVFLTMFSSYSTSPTRGERPGRKRRRSRCSPYPDFVHNILKGGVFWDIENIPVKKAIAARRVPEIKVAISNFVTKINHYNEEEPPCKSIHKFIAVARQKGPNQTPTTAEFVKKHITENEIELMDLPFSSDPDYCDEAIYQSICGFTDEHSKCMVVAMTGDVGLIRKINNINADFDLIVVTQRAGKKTTVMQRHCEKIKQTNDRGRQQAVYFMDEVIRKCRSGGVPLTYSQLLRLQMARDQTNPELENDHFRWLYSDDTDNILEDSAADTDTDTDNTDNELSASNSEVSLSSSD